MGGSKDMYQSPIEIIQRQMRTQFEDNVYKAIQDYGIVVDKEELIKALQYDREQYEKGYSDGLLASKQSEWISVEERLPEDMLPTDYKHKTIKVLVAIRGKNGVTIRTQQRFLDYNYRDDKRTAFGTWRFSRGDVTHWMPLPEAPKGGAE